MQETAFDAQFRQFIEAMLTPEGVLGIFVLIALLVGTMASPKLKWVLISLAMWVAGLSFYVQKGAREVIQLVAPLNQIRGQARPICVALLVALLVPTLMRSRGWRIRLVSSAAWAFFVFQLLLALRIVAAGETGRGLVSIFVYVLIFLVLGLGLSRWLQDWRDARTAVACIVGAVTIFFIGTCYQLVINPGGIVHKTRLFATTGNPQQAALIIAGSLPALCYFIVQRDLSKLKRIALCGMMGFLCLFLIWTGSRTGLLMSLIGVALLFRARIGKLLGVMLVSGIFLLLAYQLYSESTLVVSDMMGRGDTRTHVWRALIERFWESPAFGSLGGTFAVGENSYLAVAATLGLYGLIPLAILLVLAAIDLWKLQVRRRQMGEYMLLADLVTASLVVYAIGAIFEGYLLGTMTYQVFSIYIYLAVMRFLLDAATVTQATAGQLHLDGGYGYGYDDPSLMPPQEQQPQYASF